MRPSHSSGQDADQIYRQGSAEGEWPSSSPSIAALFECHRTLPEEVDLLSGVTGGAVLGEIQHGVLAVARWGAGR